MSVRKQEVRTTCSAGAIALTDAGELPERIQLLRMGANPARDGRITYTVENRAHAEDIVAASAAHLGSTDMVLDYDHQSVYGAKPGVGGRAEAAAWLGKLTVEDDGIWAPVEWTQAASMAVKDKRYRYISPYFGHTAGGRVTRIFNAALTNRPELELQAVASASDAGDFGDDTSMDQIASALGLTAGASADQILQAVTQLVSERTAVCSALGVANTATTDELRTAASARVDAAGYVPRAEFDTLRTQFNTLNEERVTASVDDAIASGKVAPASRAWALGLARKDPASFAEFVGSTTAIVKPGADEAVTTASQADDGKTKGKLTAEERKACSMLGLTEDEFLASKKEMVNL